MKIEVAIKDGDSPKQRGDLLEGLAKKLLEAQNYEVETEIRNTGMELDLLCKHKANNSKQIYVECKAYKESNKIQADVIKNIVGIKNIKNYTEVWLISTSEFG
ncbi:MAG TPA: restriction endonuclease, partial [Sulfurovum sp.]|nr:restriction endonuclease [Sulfurovum sp.]